MSVKQSSFLVLIKPLSSMLLRSLALTNWCFPLIKYSSSGAELPFSISISKLFSSVALYKLLASSKRDISETVGDFLPNRTDLPSSWRSLTLKQLLSHTSVIPDQIDYQIFLAPVAKR